MKAWPTIKLGTIADFKNGLNYSKENWGTGLKVVGVRDFQDYLWPRYDQLQEINPQGVVREQDYLEEGDILFVRSNGNRELIGRCLHIVHLPEHMSHSGFTIRLRFRQQSLEKIFPKYYLYLFRSSIIRAVLTAYGGGANINNLNQGILSNLDVPLPPKILQEKVASVLSSFDDLIQTNRRRVEILETIAEDVYREWFIRFRFPGFQSQPFLKGVPKSWEPSTLGAIADFTMGQSPKSEFYNETGEGLPFHQGVSTYGDRFPIRRTFCSSNGRRAYDGDILFSVRAPVGRLNIADCDMIVGRGVAAIRHKQGLSSYLYYLLRVAFSNEDIIGNGAIFNSVGKDELSKYSLLGVPQQLAEEFNDFAVPIDTEIKALLQSIGVLKRTRDALIPRLMSGQHSVADIQLPVKVKDNNSFREMELAHA